MCAVSVCKGTGTLKARTDFVVSCCWAQKRARDSPPPLFAYTQLHAYLIELAEDSVIVVEPPQCGSRVFCLHSHPV